MFRKMDYITKTNELVSKIAHVAASEGKKTGFMIGNTAKVDRHGMYFTPMRKTRSMVLGGAIVYSENQAIEIAKIVDGNLEYILVDAEKKVADSMSLSGDHANMERAVRETVKKSKIWVYKGNDLSVEAVDVFIAYLFKDSLKGLGGKKVAIIGAGNLGSKLALKLVERAADIVLTRRDEAKLKTIVDAINLIKPKYTYAEVNYTTDNRIAANGADILIGTTNGTPAITKIMVQNLSESALIIDAGKGTLEIDAIKLALKKNLAVYRLDISVALAGVVETLLEMENVAESKMGRRRHNGEHLVAGGLFGKIGDIVVDNIVKPEVIYGIANGEGDFIRNFSGGQNKKIENMKGEISKL
jgi:hypothetical protein